MLSKRFFKILSIASFVLVMLGIGYAIVQEHTRNMESKRIELLKDKKVYGKIEKRPDAPARPLPPEVEKDNDKSTRVSAAEIAIFNILKVKLDDTDSWTLVFKMLVLTLGTFLGIKIINFGFRKFA